MELQNSQEECESPSLQEYEEKMALYAQHLDELKQMMQRSEVNKEILIHERDQALEDLMNVENAFSDVYRKYERIRMVLETLRKNEDILTQRDYDMQLEIDNRDTKIQALKQMCQKTIEQMHQDYESRLKQDQMETQKLRALVRKAEMKVRSLENDLAQKGKENVQLGVLCDELINGRVSK